MKSLPTAILVSVQVGMPQALQTPTGRAWQSAIAKTPVSGKVALVGENLAGDYQANRKYHGGPDKAICGYFAAHYPGWRDEFKTDMPFGAFGENITVGELTEDDLCIGDILTVGSCRLQISQPRQPCVNVSRRWALPSLPRRMEQTGYTGFYCRALETGELAPGDTLSVLERPCPGWTLMRANTLMYGTPLDADGVNELRALAPLSAEWKRILGRKLRAASEA